MSDQHFQLEAGAAVRAWLDAHPSATPRVIAYDVHRCCGGGKICQVKVRELSRKDDPAQYSTGVMDDGTKFLIDRRAAARLPSRFGLTVRGLGRLKHLDLDLEGEQWGTLLYT
jgi:hypothetical protein